MWFSLQPSKQNQPHLCQSAAETLVAAGMSSSDDNVASHRRRNPHRICRPIAKAPASVLHCNENKKTKDLHPVRSCGLRKTRNGKQKPQAVNQSACLPKSTRQISRVNGQVSPNTHEPEPKKCPKPKYPAKTVKRSRKGRTKSDVGPCEQADVPTSDDAACFKRLENSEPASSAESQKTVKTKQTCSRPSKKKHFTCTATPLKQKITRHTKNARSSSAPHTPKRGNVKPRPLHSSTPDLKSLNRASNSCSPCHQDVTQSSPVKVCVTVIKARLSVRCL